MGADSGGGELPEVQRVAAYAVIVRDEKILLTRLAERITGGERWHLPGGGVDHGENPRDAVLREVFEETGLRAKVADRPWVYSHHQEDRLHAGRHFDYHALRIVYEGWVAPNSPQPQVQEVGGSTVAAGWFDVAQVYSGELLVTGIVLEALADYRTHQRQRLAAYGLARHQDRVLLTRISPLGHHAGSWTLPGGGVDHGESPAIGLAREISEECGVPATVGALLGIHDVHFTGVAPSGRLEDFHGVHLIFAVDVDPDAELGVVEVDGTTDAVAWVPVAEIDSGNVPVLDVVSYALGLET